MTSRFDKLLRDVRRPTEETRSGFLERHEPPGKTLRVRSSSVALGYAFVITVFAASIATSPIVFAQHSGPAKISAENSVPKSGTIPEAWPPNVAIDHVCDIGRQKAVIFSPDFAGPANRKVYEKLGFLYIEDASWRKALNEIVARNYWHPENRIETIILETHGTNGNGLKLQSGPSPRAQRSYIAIAALQEKLEGLGVRLCVIGACNAGRLFRPEIYKSLNPQPHDPLFLPATLGIINSSKEYDPARSKLTVVRRAESEIETTSDGETSELSPVTRMMLGLERPAGPVRGARSLGFTVSNLLIQMLIHDPRLKLTGSGYANEKSRNDLSEDESDVLFQRFLSYLDSVATLEYKNAHGGQLPAAAYSARPAKVIARSPKNNSRTSQAASMRAKKRSSRRVID